MQKFFTLLHSLNKKELLDFQKYLHGAHSSEKVVRKVFAYFKPFFPKPSAADEPFMRDDVAHKKIFKEDMPDTDAGRKRVQNAFYDLNKEIKLFLLLDKLRKQFDSKKRDEQFEAEALWLGVLQERQMNDSFSKEAVKLYAVHQGKKLVGLRSALRRIVAGLYFKRQLTWDNARPDYAALHACLNDIKVAADFISLQMQCEMLVMQKVRGGAQYSDTTDQPLINIYQLVLDLHKREREEDFQALEKLFYQHFKLLDITQTDLVVRHLLIFTAKKVRETDDLHWHKKAHELNKIRLENNVFAHKKSITTTDFTNAIAMACSSGEMEWAKAFLRDHSGFLPASVRQESEQLAEATISFGEGRFEEVLRLTKDFSFKEEHHHIRGTCLRLRAAYENGEDNLDIVEYCKNFEDYLARHREAGSNKALEATTAFIAAFRFLVSPKFERERFGEMVNNSPDMYFRNWLKSKV